MMDVNTIDYTGVKNLQLAIFFWTLVDDNIKLIL